jgi:predicted nucleic acid-binding protein
MNVVDSSGWIEYFLDSPQADFYASAAEDKAKLVVPSIALYEVHRFLSRKTVPAFREECLQVMRRGRVIELSDARAIAASQASQQHKLAMADAVMYSIACEFNATFWTQEVRPCRKSLRP